MTVRFAVAVPLKLSCTWNVITYEPIAITLSAAMFADTVPPVLVIAETVRPAGTTVAVTVRLPAASSASLTVATVAVVLWVWPTLTAEAAVMTGSVLFA